MDKKRSGTGEHLFSFLACVAIALILTCGCARFYEGSLAGSSFKEANDLFTRGSYAASLSKYEGIIRTHPTAGDRALFEMGIIYAYPGNEQKDYEKSLECFRKVLKDYPGSGYRADSAEMISYLDNATIKEKRIIEQQGEITRLERQVGNREREAAGLRDRIGGLERAVKNGENENAALQEKIDALEAELRNRVPSTEGGPVSRILIEKGQRRLSLISKDGVLRSYSISLGGNPKGPKERKGDHKTPEGTYIIDWRNRDSGYHLSLHISYPNEKDKQRARELGVSPGGDIMIHGIKNGFSWVGARQAGLDWTEGCIAVTDEEIEEIARLVPDGTIVEIKP